MSDNLLHRIENRNRHYSTMQNSEGTHELNKLITRLYDQTPLIGSKLRYDAAKALAKNGSPEAIDTLAEALIRSDDSRIQKVALKALLELATEDRIEAQEALCRLVIEHEHPLARELVLAAQYAPRDPAQRALFYFLTEQWDKYEALDVDQGLLKMLFETTEPEMRERLTECAHRSKRLEWVSIVSGGRKRKRASEMTDQEWETTLNVIIRQGAWHDLWRLVHVAPAMWSVRFLLWLRDVQWQSEQVEEQEAFMTLVHLAEGCNKGDSDLLLYGLIYCRTTLGRYTGGITCLAMSPDSKVLASGNEDSTVRLWRLPDGAVVQTLEEYTGYVVCLAISPDSKILASGNENGVIRLWRLSDGAMLKTLEEGQTRTVEGLTFSHDGRILASGGDNTIRLWRLPEGTPLQTPKRHAGSVTCIAISPDGHVLASGYDDGSVQLWHLPDGTVLPALKGHDTEVTCLVFSPDGKMLASASSARPLSDIFYRDPCIQFWRLPDGTALRRLEGHAGSIECIAFSPDGRILASGGGGEDKTVRLWRSPDGAVLQTLKEHICGVTCLTFSPDGQILATGSSDGILRLWDLELVDLRRLKVGQTGIKELQLLQERLQEGNMTDMERRWLKFLLALMLWNQKYDTETGEIPQQIRVGEFDVELE